MHIGKTIQSLAPLQAASHGHGAQEPVAWQQERTLSLLLLYPQAWAAWYCVQIPIWESFLFFEVLNPALTASSPFCRVVKEEISDDNAKLPCFNGRVVSWVSKPLALGILSLFVPSLKNTVLMWTAK